MGTRNPTAHSQQPTHREDTDAERMNERRRCYCCHYCLLCSSAGNADKFSIPHVYITNRYCWHRSHRRQLLLLNPRRNQHKKSQAQSEDTLDLCAFIYLLGLYRVSSRHLPPIRAAASSERAPFRSSASCPLVNRGRRSGPSPSRPRRRAPPSQ